MTSLKMTPELAESLAVLDDADRIGVSPPYLVQTVLKRYREALDAVPQPIIDDLDARMPEAVLQRAVIEAAEACVHWNYPPEPMHDAERWDALIRAVEALEEVKGG